MVSKEVMYKDKKSYFGGAMPTSPLPSFLQSLLFTIIRKDFLVVSQNPLSLYLLCLHLALIIVPQISFVWLKSCSFLEEIAKLAGRTGGGIFNRRFSS